jgi:hypothetical protein
MAAKAIPAKVLGRFASGIAGKRSELKKSTRNASEVINSPSAVDELTPLASSAYL